MAQIKLNIIQIVHMPHYEKLLIQIVNMAHICENDMIQIKDMFQIVAIRSSCSRIRAKASWKVPSLKAYITLKLRYTQNLLLYAQGNTLQDRTYFISLNILFII